MNKTLLWFLTAAALSLLPRAARGDIMEHVIEITSNGSPSDPNDYIELFITSLAPPCPPTLSPGFLFSYCGSGTVNCTGDEEELASALADGLSGCLPGVHVTSRANQVILTNNKDLSGIDLFFCLATLECPSPYAYGLTEDCGINNICSGVCGDEDEAPGSAGFNFSLATRLLTGIQRADVRITRTGPVVGAGIIEYFLTEGEHPCPPTLSNGFDDQVCRSGVFSVRGLSAAGLASKIAEGLAADPNCPDGIEVSVLDNVLTVINDKSISGRDLYHCVNMVECADPFGYGLDNCTVNNVGSGSCGDEADAAGTSGFHFEHIGSGDCFAGTVNAGRGTIEDVLLVNESAGEDDRTVEAALEESLTVALESPSAGPAEASYILWVWPGATRSLFDASPSDLDVGSGVLGRTVNPTPLHPFSTPQPFRCLNGGLADAFCAGVDGINNPPEAAPFEVTKTGGLRAPRSFTLQGIVEDDGSEDASGYSVTNAVVLVVE